MKVAALFVKFPKKIVASANNYFSASFIIILLVCGVHHPPNIDGIKWHFLQINDDTMLHVKKNSVGRSCYDVV